jgi:hypothetical protein
MKYYWIFLLGMGYWACTSTAPDAKEQTVVQPLVDSTIAVDFFQDKATAGQRVAFLPLLDSSYYTQRDSFVQVFRRHYQVPAAHALLGLQTTRLYGAPDSLFWLRFGNSQPAPDCSHPMLEQHFIFDHKGRLLYQNYVQHGQFLANAIDSTPIYVTVEHGCAGTGRHYAYVWQAGQLLDVLNPLFENTPITFDAQEDSSVFQGGALLPFVKDANGDGAADLVLKGVRLDLYSRSGKRFGVRRPYRRKRVAYYFLYQPAKEIFVFAPNFRSVAR